MAIKSSQTLVSEALKEIKTISTDEAHKMVNDNKCNLIDIRDIRELQKEGQVVGVAASTESLYYTEKEGVQNNLQMVFKNCVPVSQLLELIGG